MALEKMGKGMECTAVEGSRWSPLLLGGKVVETSKDAGRLTSVLGGDEVGLFCVDTCKVLL